MKIIANFYGHYKANGILLHTTNEADSLLVKRLFENKDMREKRLKKSIALECTLSTQEQNRSYKQLRTVWKLVTIIFESMEGRKPCESEKTELYLDLLDAYADRIPNKIEPNKTRPVHISEANTITASHFIDALLNHLALECGLQMDLQAEVRGILFEWERWRGAQSNDFMDNIDVKNWHPQYSEASGAGGSVDRHHILSRGAYPQYINCGWNILALTREEHNYFHQKGWNMFLARFPHLTSRVERAFIKGKKHEVL